MMFLYPHVVRRCFDFILKSMLSKCHCEHVIVQRLLSLPNEQHCHIYDSDAVHSLAAKLSELRPIIFLFKLKYDADSAYIDIVLITVSKKEDYLCHIKSFNIYFNFIELN